MQPGKQSFNSPAAPIATQWPAILGLAPRGAVVPMRGDHLDADCGHLAIQFVTVISFVSDQALGPFLCETAVDGGRDESDFMRTRRLDVNGDWSAIAVCHCHELRTLTPLGLADGSAPFFALTKLPSMKRRLTPMIRASSMLDSRTRDLAQTGSAPPESVRHPRPHNGHRQSYNARPP